MIHLYNMATDRTRKNILKQAKDDTKKKSNLKANYTYILEQPKDKIFKKSKIEDLQHRGFPGGHTTRY